MLGGGDEAGGVHLDLRRGLIVRKRHFQNLFVLVSVENVVKENVAYLPGRVQDLILV